MKLKVLFITFNIVLFGLLFTIFFLPLFYVDGSFIREFWNNNWFFGPIFLAIILIINIIFFKNKKLIDYVENENGLALAKYLESEVFDKNKTSFRNVNLLTDSLIILSDFSTINRLENFLQKNKQSYLLKLSTKFIAAKMLEGNFISVLDFTAKFTDSEKAKNEWLYFYHAFALQMKKEYTASISEFKAIRKKTKKPLIKLLSAYFVLKVFTDQNELSTTEEEKSLMNLRQELGKLYSKVTWQKYIEKEKQEVHAMLLSKVIEDASSWLFV